jgi:hypothetical protein
MKKDENECYNKLFERITSIETRIKTIKENLSILKNIFNEKPQRKKDAEQNCAIPHPEESPHERKH